MIGLYIHIPFCVHKCLYCDFPSYGGVRQYIPGYVQALCREIRAFSQKGLRADTVYIGGGTPSLLSVSQLSSIMDALQQTFSLAADAEITLEANPDSMDASYAAAIASLGVNRVSLGVQSFDDRMLCFLGRVHTAAAARRAVEDVWHGGIDNISIDLMYGLPHQTQAMVQRDLKILSSLPVCHASIYSLIVEEHTPLQAQLQHHDLSLPADEEVEAMARDIHRTMRKWGYEHYEISSYARQGKRSRHNCKYWQYVPYIGFGVSAHSFYQGTRWANIANIPMYIRRAGQGSVTAERVPIDDKRAKEDYCFLALRMHDGISYAAFANEFGTTVETEFGSVLSRLFQQKLLEKTAAGCRLSDLGLAYGNYVFSQFIRS